VVKAGLGYWLKERLWLSCQTLTACLLQELKTGVVPLLIATPNATNDIGYNRDRFLLNPSLTSDEHLRMFRFFGILLGVAVRTKKPLDLYLAPPVWKLLAGMALTSDDLDEVLFYTFEFIERIDVLSVYSITVHVDGNFMESYSMELSF